MIAGGGALPLRAAAAARARGEGIYVIRLAGAADPALAAWPGEECAMGEAGRILRLLKEQECDAVVFAGVVRRPDFKSLKVDWRGAALLPKVIAAAARGDGALLSALVETVEAEGMFVIGAEEVAGDVVAAQGAMGAHAPGEDDLRDMRKAAQIIEALGPFDVGQAAVVAAGHALAIEAAEGTDAMLDRCAAVRAGTLPDKTAPADAAPADVAQTDAAQADATPCGVLMKRPKPGQELRIDLPVIGPETIRRALAAGLRGVAVEAGVAIVIDRDEVVRLADGAGLFVYGFTAAEARAGNPPSKERRAP